MKTLRAVQTEDRSNPETAFGTNTDNWKVLYTRRYTAWLLQHTYLRPWLWMSTLFGVIAIVCFYLDPHMALKPGRVATFGWISVGLVLFYAIWFDCYLALGMWAAHRVKREFGHAPYFDRDSAAAQHQAWCSVIRTMAGHHAAAKRAAAVRRDDVKALQTRDAWANTATVEDLEIRALGLAKADGEVARLRQWFDWQLRIIQSRFLPVPYEVRLTDPDEWARDANAPDRTDIESV